MELDTQWKGEWICNLTPEHLKNIVRLILRMQIPMCTRGQWECLKQTFLDRFPGTTFNSKPPKFKGEPDMLKKSPPRSEDEDAYDVEVYGATITPAPAVGPRISRREVSLDDVVWSPLSNLTREQFFDAVMEGNLFLRTQVVKEGQLLPTAGRQVRIEPPVKETK